MLLPKTSLEVDAVRIDTFAWWLARSRLVFLSSCKSTEADFLFHLADENVPAVLGFRWEVEDDKARAFAACFYQHLFGGQRMSLEYAFLETRKQMHRTYPTNPIWAAPVLVMQVAAEEAQFVA